MVNSLRRKTRAQHKKERLLLIAELVETRKVMPEQYQKRLDKFGIKDPAELSPTTLMWLVEGLVNDSVFNGF